MAATTLLRALRRRRRGPALIDGGGRSLADGLGRLRPGLAVVAAVVCVAAVAVAALGAPDNEAFARGLFELLVVGGPMVAGIYALRAPADARFGLALLVTGFAWSLTALAETSASVPYTIGRLATWLVPPSVYVLLIVFPEGRLAGRLERALSAALAALAVMLFYGSALFVETYPLHTPWATCATDCPANAVFVLHAEPAVMGDVILPLREGLLAVLLAGLVVSMVRRWRAASPLRRRSMGPVVAIGTALAACHVAFYATRRAGAPATVVETLGAVWGVCVVGVAAAFLVALFRRRLVLAEAAARLSETVRGRPGTARLREALRAALGDPTLQLVLRDEASDRWYDSSGHETSSPGTPPGRMVTVVAEDDAGPAMALIHDPALRDDQVLLSVAASVLRAGWRYDRVLAGLDRAMAALEDSRRRIAETADVERARIERDLHDGAQQRLVALRIRLSLAETTLRDDPAAGAEAVRELAIEAERALDDLRSHAQGVFPSTLRDLGLDAALRALARDSPMAVNVTVDGLTRHPIDIESAIYFICAEAVQNTMKHARTATGVWIEVTEDHAVRFEIRDDGTGFLLDHDRPHLRGLRNMRDRIDALGGELTIDTAPGRGTRIIGVVEPAAATAAPLGPALAAVTPTVAGRAATRTAARDAEAGAPPDHAGEATGTDAGALPELLVYERLVPALAGIVSRLRRELDDALARHGVAGAERSDIALTLTEATTNVVQHAYRDGSPGPLYVAAALRGRALTVSVIDDGSGMRARPNHPGAGLGLTLMARLADHLAVVSDASEPGTAVHATFENVSAAETTAHVRDGTDETPMRVTEAGFDGAEHTLARARRRRRAVHEP